MFGSENRGETLFFMSGHFDQTMTILKIINFKLLRYKILHSPERFRRIDRRPQRLL